MILRKIKNRDENLAHYLVTYCNPRDVARAVFVYLVKKKPLLSKRIQQLIGSSNAGVTSRMVAFDTLGLIMDEFQHEAHLKLIQRLMETLKELATRGSLRPTEVRGSPVPFILYQLFLEETVIFS